MARTKKIIENEKVETTKKKVENKIPETVEKAPEDLTAHVIYHKGDNIEEIAKMLTGHAYMIYRLVESNGYTMGNIPDGAILKWKV